jgi:tetratricopeptide (TPR) repeat protein
VNNLQELLAKAVGHHRFGQLPEAERLYREILQADSCHADALHLLGVIAHQVGQNDVAVELIGKAIGIDSSVADYHSNLGSALRALSRAKDAVAAYRLALIIRPNFAEACFNLGNTLKDSGQLDDAVAAYGAALRIRPDYAETYTNLGNALHRLERIDDAVAAYGEALRNRPDLVEARSNLGNALGDLGRLREAAAAHRVALCIEPDYVEAYSNLGNILHRLGRPDDAVLACRAALHLTPAYAEAHSNLGNALKDLGFISDAVTAYSAALIIRPDFAEAYSNLGNALRDLGCIEKAVAVCQAALRIRPNFAEAHFNESMSRLALGDFAVGWPKYEWRWHGGSKRMKPRRFTQPEWRGEDIAGSTVLLHTEQGLGDHIQFCRYASLVSARGGKVLLETPQRLLRILSRLAGVDQLVIPGDPLPDFDVHCPIMSLPLAFGTTIDTIPSAASYLTPDPGLVAIWRERLAHVRGRKIGVVWRGSPSHQRDRYRSVDPALFAHVLATPGLNVVSVQKNGRPDELSALGAKSLFDAGPLLDDFSETAGLIANLDLVISVDTSVCHLAGALGVPTWTILDFAADWRWLTDRHDSPWYPTMRLFRQAKIGEWKDVFERVAVDLQSLILGMATP